ncbi:MAG: UDP-N-acetylmuramate dehydrogenase [Desulfobulbaceae bacterium]|nr:UDP-N-acetylmuramate dehydrogenase [Desulfobulbaceae bacterium]
MNRAQHEKITALVSQPVSWQCRLDSYTSLSIGGPAEAVVKVDKRSELQSLLAFLAEDNIAWRVVGRGTNLLVRDEGFAGVIVILGTEFKTALRQPAKEGDKVIVRVGAGHALAQFSSRCTEWGLTGIEFGCGIPGTMGGAVIMNAGAWGGEMSSIVESVRLTTAQGEERLVRNGLNFSYRSWNGFAPYLGKAVISEVELELETGDPVAIRQYCGELQNRRKKTQGCKYPNAGSFFKNPANDSAGRLIDSSGLKGTIIGGAMISEHHGNFLVNRGGATAADVLNLMKIVQARVKVDSGVSLEPEIHLI